VVNKIRQVLAWALAGGLLWLSTIAVPILGLSYWLGTVVVDRLEHLVRRLAASRRGPLL
jgi:hypothetical protein